MALPNLIEKYKNILGGAINQGISNIKGNVQAISSPQMRQEWVRGIASTPVNLGKLNQPINSFVQRTTPLVQHPIQTSLNTPVGGPLVNYYSRKLLPAIKSLPTSQYVMGRGQELAQRTVGGVQNLQKPGVMNKALGGLQLAGGLLGATPQGMVREGVVGVPLAGIKSLSQIATGEKVNLGQNIKSGVTGVETLGTSTNPVLRKILGQEGGDIASQAIDIVNMALGFYKGGKYDPETAYLKSIEKLPPKFQRLNLSIKPEKANFDAPVEAMSKLKREIPDQKVPIIARMFAEARKRGEVNPADIKDIESMTRSHLDYREINKWTPEAKLTELYKHAVGDRVKVYPSTVDSPKLSVEPVGGKDTFGTVKEWGTRNQYLSMNPYRKQLDKMKISGKFDEDVLKKSEQWELEQVLKDKPAYLADSSFLSKEEIKAFAKKHKLWIRTDKDGALVVAKDIDSLNRVLNASNQRELGLALGYEDILSPSPLGGKVGGEVNGQIWSKPQVSNKEEIFNILTNQGNKRVSGKRVKLGFGDIEFFAHKDGNGWVLSEVSSGRNISGQPAPSIEEAITTAQATLSSLNKRGEWDKFTSQLSPSKVVGASVPAPIVKPEPPATLGQSKLSQSDVLATKQPIQSIPKTETPLKPGGGQSGNPKNPSSENIIQDPVQTIIQALKEAKPIRSEQNKLYSKERAIRVAKLSAVGKNVPGEQGYFAQLGQLKGELPKVQFEGIRSKVTQLVIDDLFNKVENAAISPFEKVTAKGGLVKLLGAEGGVVPNNSEMKLLSEIFPPEFVQSIMDKRSTMQKLFAVGQEALNLPRAVMATADLSAPLRQGVFLVGRPKQWIPAFKEMFKYAGSEKAYKGLFDDIRSRPTYQAMRQSKLALTDMSPVLQGREEAFMSNLAEKIPGFGKLVKGSDRAYSGFLNKLRADTFDSLYNNAKSLGLLEDNTKVADDIAKFVNSATGRGDLGALNKASVVLNGAFFSPRLMASRINLLNPAYYMKLEPFVRKEALKSLLTFAGTGATVLTLAKLSGAEVGTDPRSADFGKIKVGDTRFDIWGGFQQYMVLASRLISGQMVSSTTGKEFNLGEGYKPTTRMDIIQRFVESKAAPVLSFALGLLKGQNSIGEKFNLPAEIVDRFIPMVAQDMSDLYNEWGPRGLLMGVPGLFGVGSQTYTDQIPMKGKTPSGKENIQWRTAPGLGEKIVNKITGTEISNIPQDQWPALQEKRKIETQWNIDYSAVKAKVLNSGQEQTVHNPVTNKDIRIYLKDGVVTTQDVSPKVTKPKVKKPKKLSLKKVSLKAPKIKIASAKIPKIKKIRTKKTPRIIKLAAAKSKLAKIPTIKKPTVKKLKKVA